MQELFMQAYRFINRPSYWQAVMQLAEFILAHDHDTISCEEIITVFNHYHR
nr:hypothetical protein [Methylomarinum sp. Ch1-1]MDP4522615.1 hypothetical protein [Methylomarinum sp. Ch1-1]